VAGIATSLLIRDATRDDLPAIVAIYNASIPGRMATSDPDPVTVEARGPWFEEHSPKRPIWVAVSAGEVVGWLSFQSFYGRPAYQATAEVSVYVATERQRTGIGRAMVTKAVAEAPGLGLKTLLGFIFAHNVPSLRLFESFGFERWAFLPRVAELDGIERDLVIVGLRLP
jgi:phosphinothricin acetyltransferase